MNIYETNGKAWNEEVLRRNYWTLMVGQEAIQKAHEGKPEIWITPFKLVPASWIEDLKGKEVLLACGAGGQQTPILAAFGCNVTTLDISQGQLDQDRKALEKNSLEASLVNANILDMPFEDKRFDAVIIPQALNFIDDIEVTKKLMEAVEAWGKERGMTKMVGPLGFTDMDLEGMLTDGYDQLSTMNSIYNYPYYPEHMKKLGFEKEVGWVERKVFVPRPGHSLNEQKYFKIAELVKKRYGFRIHKFKSKKEIREGGYIKKVLDVVNRSYANLYGYSEMDEKQMQVYADQYLQYLDKRYLSVVETAEGEVIGMGICITSLSRAIQKAKAKLFPFGWYHMAKALWFDKHPQVLDMLLVGVLPEYQDKGANALIFADLIPEGQKDGYEWAETHHQLEDNIPSQAQWKNLEHIVHKKRCAFSKAI